jgi:hypothetical protein
MLLLQKDLGALTACGIDKSHVSWQTLYFFPFASLSRSLSLSLSLSLYSSWTYTADFLLYWFHLLGNTFLLSSCNDVRTEIFYKLVCRKFSTTHI